MGTTPFGSEAEPEVKLIIAVPGGSGPVAASPRGRRVYEVLGHIRGGGAQERASDDPVQRERRVRAGTGGDHTARHPVADDGDGRWQLRAGSRSASSVAYSRAVRTELHPPKVSAVIGACPRPSPASSGYSFARAPSCARRSPIIPSPRRRAGLRAPRSASWPSTDPGSGSVASGAVRCAGDDRRRTLLESLRVGRGIDRKALVW
jgi:hypothetical protein